MLRTQLQRMKKLLLVAMAVFAMLNMHATIWTITNSGNSFTPSLVTITQGDTVLFQLAGTHNAQEVDLATYNANGSTPITGFQTNFGGGQVTGLTIGTHYYVCSPHAAMGMKGRIVVNAAPVVVVPNVWINELHYDNSGSDSNEGFEIAGPSGTDLSCYKVYLYNGSNGQVYDSLALSGFLPFQACQFGTKWFDIPGSGVLQNGNPDGLAVVYAPQLTGCGMGGVDTVLQFLSYGGTFTATNGRLRFQTSQDIGVTEGSGTLATESMQLTGRGKRYADFTWIADTASTHNALNVGQEFCGNQHFTLLPATISQFENLGQVIVPVFLDSASQNPTQVTIALVSAGTTATVNSDFVFSDTTLTWPVNTSGYIQVPIYLLNDNLYELDEYVKVVLRNPTNNATITADSVMVVTIKDNDPLTGGDCTDLFFSEYVEGTGDNKAIEIYNPTANAINLADYTILKSVNGGAAVSYGLAGSLAGGAVYVLANPNASTAITTQADVLTAFVDFDGNDALALVHLNDTIDVIGVLGNNPGSSFTVGIGSTQNQTIIRNYYRYEGSDVWDTAKTQYSVFAADMFDSLGVHNTAACGTPPPPPPAYLSFEWTSDTVAEGAVDVMFAVRFENPAPVSYTYVIAYDNLLSTAANNIDFNYANQIVTHGQGTFIDTFIIRVYDDALIEQTENVLMRFINLPANVYTTQDSIYNLYITDIDQLNISFLGAGLTFSEADGLVKVKVVISTPADTATEVRVSLAPGSATLGTDFLFTDTTIVFPANSADTQAVYVTIIEDIIDEGNEQVNFNLTNATNGANILISAFTLTIIDNDSTIIGINEIDFDNTVKMYPNPAFNILTIQSETDLNVVTITDLIGNTVIKSEALTAGKNSLDVTALPAGMYVVNVLSDNKALSRKFIKAD